MNQDEIIKTLQTTRIRQLEMIISQQGYDCKFQLEPLHLKIRALQMQIENMTDIHEKELEAVCKQNIACVNELKASYANLEAENMNQAQEISKLKNKAVTNKERIQDTDGANLQEKLQNLEALVSKCKTLCVGHETYAEQLKLQMNDLECQNSELLERNAQLEATVNNYQLELLDLQKKRIEASLTEPLSSQQLFHFTASCVLVETGLITKISRNDIEALYADAQTENIPVYNWHIWISNRLTTTKTMTQRKKSSIFKWWKKK